VGGGIRALEDARRLLAAGADKVAINTGAVENPKLLNELASRYGTQAIVVAVDARRISDPNDHSALRWEVVTYGGALPTGIDAVEWVRKVEALGAGEILLTSMDADGTEAGFDCALTAAASRAVKIPVIASGGAGSPEHFAEVFLNGGADAALAASVFHFKTHTLRGLKEFLHERGVPVRL
jgi:cyclase